LRPTLRSFALLSFPVIFLACAILSTGIAVLAHEVREDKGRPVSLDLRAGETMARIRTPQLDRIMSAVTQLGAWQFLLPATILLIVAFWRTGHRVSTFLFAGSVVGGFGLGAILKVAVTRARPALWPSLVVESTYSYPSGHTVMATVFFGGLAAIVFHLRRDLAARGAAVAIAAAVILLVASSRVYLGAHWATDTIGGMMTGMIWVLIYAAAVESATRQSGKSAGRGEPDADSAPR
jgi:undecaprenyl-diphosphatase